MGDVKYWESTYSKALDQFEGFIVKAEKSKQEARDSAIADAAKCERRIDGIRRSYNLEVRLIKEQMDKRIYQKDKENKDKTYEALRTRLADVKSKSNEEKKQLLVGSRPQGAGASEGTSGDKTLDKADKIQDMTEKKYENMISIIQDTEEVGGKAARSLIDQREQIGVITEDVMEIEDSLTRSEMLLKSFSKRMNCPKPQNGLLISGDTHHITFAIKASDRDALSQGPLLAENGSVLILRRTFLSLMEEANAELERVGVKREDRLDLALDADEGAKSEADDCEDFKREKDNCNTIHSTNEEKNDDRRDKESTSSPTRVVEMSFELGDFDDTVIAAMEDTASLSATSPDARGCEPVLASESHQQSQSRRLKPLIQPIDGEEPQ